MENINFSLHSDHPHEECGVLGIFAPQEDVARMAEVKQKVAAFQHKNARTIIQDDQELYGKH